MSVIVHVLISPLYRPSPITSPPQYHVELTLLNTTILYVVFELIVIYSSAIP